MILKPDNFRVDLPGFIKLADDLDCPLVLSLLDSIHTFGSLIDKRDSDEKDNLIPYLRR